MYPMLLTITETSKAPPIRPKKRNKIPWHSRIAEGACHCTSGVPPVGELCDSSQVASAWHLLPDMALYNILLRLSLPEMYSVFLTCTSWSQLSNSELLWKERWLVLLDLRASLLQARKSQLRGQPLKKYKEPRGIDPRLEDPAERGNTRYKEIVQQLSRKLVSEECWCVPIRHKHSHVVDSCYVACHEAFLSSLEHAVRLFYMGGFQNQPITYKDFLDPPRATTDSAQPSVPCLVV
jgi:hypothetical protein